MKGMTLQDSFGIRCCHAAAMVSMILLAFSCRLASAEEVTAKVKLPDEVERSLAALVNFAAVIKSNALVEDMTKVVAGIVDATKTGDEGQKQLESEAKAAVEKSIAPWKKDLETRLRPFLSDEIKTSLDTLAQWPAEMLVNNGFINEPAKPAEQQEWKDSLKKILSPGQIAAMEQIAQSREQALEKEIQDYLKPHVAKMRKRQVVMLKSEAEDLKKVAEMNGERAGKVIEMALVAARRNADAIEKRWAGEIRGLPDEARMQLNMNKDESPFMNEDEDAPLAMEVWKKELIEFLSPDEQRRWAAVSVSRKKRQSRALSALVVSEIDSKVFLTAAQRDKLEPLAEMAITPKTKIEWDNFSFEGNDLLNLLQDKLKLVIDEKQLRHLKNQNENEVADGRTVESRGKKKKASSVGDTDLDVEDILSVFFHAHDAEQRSRLADGMLAKLESIQRVVKLSEEGSRRLEMATRGAAEHALDLWRPNCEQWVRNSMKNVSAKTLKQRLETLNIEGSFDNQISPFEQPIWINTVGDVLTEAQMESLANDVIGRKTYRNHARVLIILEELNWTYHLSLEQLDKLEPFLQQVVVEYASDIIQTIGSDSGSTRQMSVFLAGVPEEKIKSILTSEQFEQWKISDKDLWKNIKSNHDQRLKRNGSRNASRLK